jgi:hypothetical protein
MFHWNVKRWLHEHSLKLLAIRDTPEAIAGGVTIGIFFGFMPLFGMKTALALLFAWITRSNIIAAILAGTLHDIILPLMPLIYRWEYQIGFYLLQHHWPSSFKHMRWERWSWHEWTKNFRAIGKPLCLGGLVISIPSVPLTFLVTRAIVARHQRKKAAEQQASSPAPTSA